MEKYSDLLQAIYEYYACGNNEKRYGLQLYFEKFDALTKDLPFAKTDAIISARNALCANMRKPHFWTVFRRGRVWF